MNILNIKKQGNRKKVYLFGKKVLSYKCKHSKFEKIYAKRFEGLSDDELKYCIMEQYKEWHGEYPNIDNPSTFNEKLTWEKLYYRNPLMTVCADKVKGRDYFCDKVNGGEKYLVKQYGIYESPEEIDFNSLPNSFVLKSNWGSGRQFVVKDKSKFDIEAAKNEMKLWMQKESNQYYFSFETGYKDIEPKIVCEEFLDFDYKLEFFCFNGEPKFFWIVFDDKTDNTSANFYSLDWENLHIFNHYPNFDKEIVKPSCYEEILDNSKKMCGDFPFVRCDFYITKNGYRFSEMTFFHWGANQNFEPYEWNKKIGDMMKLPNIV